MELAGKKELIDILVCPIRKGNLVLNVGGEGEGEVVSGSLYCPECNAHYLIVDTIPNLLPQASVIN